ncbi:histidine phosphatase family protein, partial [Pseudomonas viridiflava]|uniref:histidine phosphatase family protein n=1 Tax=Pseudomonas viridiflava TaxID=33069 RepID=UPI0013CEE4EE
YLDPARCVNTTVAQRRDWVREYWNQANPLFVDGDGAESFIELVSRAQSFLERLEAHPAKDIVVFSHGQFINAVAWLIERQPTVINSHAMIDWREYEIANHVENCGGYRLI